MKNISPVVIFVVVVVVAVAVVVAAVVSQCSGISKRRSIGASKVAHS